MKPSIQVVLATLIASTIAALFPACSGVRGDAPEIRVGVLANFTNEFARTSGRPTMYAAQLAARQINASGGIAIGGQAHRVTLVFKDFEDRPDAASTAARALINQDEVDILIGPQFSRHAVPVALLAENAKVPMISPMSSSPLTTQDKRYVFRLAFLDEVQSQAMARFAFDELDARRAAILFNVSSKYSRNLADSFRNEFTRVGGEVVASEEYTSDEDTEFGDALHRISVSGAEVLWLPNWTPTVKEQIKQAKKASLDVTLLGGDTWDIQILGELEASQGAYVTHQWHEDLATVQTRSFVRLFRDTYGETPGSTAAITYDAFGVLRKAVEGQEVLSAESIRQGLTELGRFDGVSGTLEFDGGGDPKRTAVICRIDGGKPVLQRLVGPRTQLTE